MTTCKAFKKYKAIYEPRCNCDSCWDKYFTQHPEVVFTAKLGIQHFTTAGVAKVRGNVFVKQLQRFLRNEKHESRPNLADEVLAPDVLGQESVPA